MDGDPDFPVTQPYLTESPSKSVGCTSQLAERNAKDIDTIEQCPPTIRMTDGGTQIVPTQECNSPERREPAPSCAEADPLESVCERGCEESIAGVQSGEERAYSPNRIESPDLHGDRIACEGRDDGLEETVEKERVEERMEREQIENERVEQERLEEERMETERLEEERREKERIEKEQMEMERIENERIEKERIENEILERERKEKEKIEKERLENEKLEKERLEMERLEMERIEKERLENEKLEKELQEEERREKEQLEMKRKENERVEKERVEQERIEKELVENERVEKERMEKERVEKERIEKERVEKERIEQERMEKERMEQERIEKERIEQERIEKERMEQERIEKERMEKERVKKERMEKERVKKERIEEERIEEERIEQEQIEKEKIEKERIEQERLEKEQIEKEKMEQKLANEQHMAKERLETERVKKESVEAEHVKKECVGKKRVKGESGEASTAEEHVLAKRPRQNAERDRSDVSPKRSSIKRQLTPESAASPAKCLRSDSDLFGTQGSTENAQPQATQVMVEKELVGANDADDMEDPFATQVSLDASWNEVARGTQLSVLREGWNGTGVGATELTGGASVSSGVTGRGPRTLRPDFGNQPDPFETQLACFGGMPTVEACDPFATQVCDFVAPSCADTGRALVPAVDPFATQVPDFGGVSLPAFDPFATQMCDFGGPTVGNPERSLLPAFDPFATQVCDFGGLTLGNGERSLVPAFASSSGVSDNVSIDPFETQAPLALVAAESRNEMRPPVNALVSREDIPMQTTTSTSLVLSEQLTPPTKRLFSRKKAMPKLRPVFLFTGIPDDAKDVQCKFKALFKNVGVSEEWGDDITHVVAAGPPLKRTLKVLCGICKGLPIVSMAYVQRCLRERQLVSEDNSYHYEELREALSRSREKRLLADFRAVYIFPSINKRRQWRPVIEAAGSTLLQSFPTKGRFDGVLLLGMASDTIVLRRRNIKSPLYDFDMLQQGCTTQQCDFDRYLL